MAIKSSSATFTRFFVPEIPTEDFWSTVDEKLKSGAFKDLEDGEEQAAGFSSWEDLFEPDFSSASYHKGEYAAFSFRMDQRKVPAIVLKQYVRQSVQRFREENEGRWPSRRERLDIQENMQNWLMNRALPRPSGFEVVWNPAANCMLLGTTSTKMVDVFLDSFENLFRIYPVPLYHVQWAMHLLPLDGNQKDFLNSLVNVRSATAMDEGRFFGYEFLTWLWFFSEADGGAFQVGGKEAQLYLGERVVLTLPNEGREKVVCTTQANSLHEARTALRQGKLVQEIQLFLMIGENEYLLTLDSSLWAVKGLKTPKALPDYDEEDPDGPFFEKMYFIEEVSSALDVLFHKFLGLRLTSGWESDGRRLLEDWMSGKAEETA